MRTTWDYTNLARFYDKRAEYSDSAIDNLLSSTQTRKTQTIADIGAGTGKLTVQLLKRGFNVTAVEPNDEMRKFGIQNTTGKKVVWKEGTGENTTIAKQSIALITFGSSFNVTDRTKTLLEVSRILLPGGWFACMWNHRDLKDPFQESIEQIIHHHVPNYDYGSRREDQSKVINESGFFGDVAKIEGNVVHNISGADYIEAWKSHATLERQAGEKFQIIIKDIEKEMQGKSQIDVPYTTRIWFAQYCEN